MIAVVIDWHDDDGMIATMTARTMMRRKVMMLVMIMTSLMRMRAIKMRMTMPRMRLSEDKHENPWTISTLPLHPAIESINGCFPNLVYPCAQTGLTKQFSAPPVQ